MTGMGRGLSAHSSFIVSAFHHALWLQFLVVLLIVALLAVARSLIRSRQFSALAAESTDMSGPERPIPEKSLVGVAEPVAHRVLRIGFGLIWLLDGILQGQAAMPLSLPSQVMTPAASSSPT